MNDIDWKHITIPNLAAVVQEHLKAHGISTVLVGGACVSIYSENQYMSFDLDFVTYHLMQTVRDALSLLGFEQKKSRYFIHKDCPYYVEFVSHPVAVGKNEVITQFKTLKTKKGSVVLLKATDCVKDRLAAYYHWNDLQSLEQAVMVAKAQKINLHDIERWSIEENAREKFHHFKKILEESYAK